MLIGTQVKSGFVGHNPVIHDNVTVADNLEMQHAYRSVYATILKKWWNASDDDIAVSVPGNFPQPDLFKQTGFHSAFLNVPEAVIFLNRSPVQPG